MPAWLRSQRLYVTITTVTSGRATSGNRITSAAAATAGIPRESAGRCGAPVRPGGDRAPPGAVRARPAARSARRRAAAGGWRAPNRSDLGPSAARRATWSSRQPLRQLGKRAVERVSHGRDRSTAGCRRRAVPRCAAVQIRREHRDRRVEAIAESGVRPRRPAPRARRQDGLPPAVVASTATSTRTSRPRCHRARPTSGGDARARRRSRDTERRTSDGRRVGLRVSDDHRELGVGAQRCRNRLDELRVGGAAETRSERPRSRAGVRRERAPHSAEQVGAPCEARRLRRRERPGAAGRRTAPPCRQAAPGSRGLCAQTSRPLERR